MTQVNNVTIPFISDFLYTTLDCYEGSNVTENEVNVSVYPNPTRDFLNVSSYDHAVDIQVMNMLGERFSFPVSSDGKINVSALPSGVYCLEFEIGKKIIITKFVKQ